MKLEPWEELRKKLLEIDGARLFKKRGVRIPFTTANLEKVAKAFGITDPPKEVGTLIERLLEVTKFKHTEEFLCTFDEISLRAFCTPASGE